MPTSKRRKYLEENLREMPISSLRHIAAEYGVRDSDEDTKDCLIEIIVDGVLEWARKMDLQEAV